MIAFITGSRAYGTPRIDSDIDVVVRVTEETATLIRQLSNAAGDPKVPVKFGAPPSLNLILCTSDASYQAWEQGTHELILRSIDEDRPIPRDEAIARFTELRAAVGINPS